MTGIIPALSPTPPLPGLRACVFANGLSLGEENWYRTPGHDRAYHVKIGNWFSAWLPKYKHTSTNCARLGDELTIFLEGYITGITSRAVLVDDYAKVILSKYKVEGLDFVKELRGSFTILICDSAKNVAHIISDRRRSRPMFLRKIEGGNVYFSPEVRELLRIGDAPQPNLRTEAAVEFLIMGSSCSDHTLFSGLFSLPQATVITCSPLGTECRQYWRMGFHDPHDEKDEDALVEECHALIQQAVHRTLGVVHNPFLFLSGGVDSRVVLGSLLEQGEKVPVVMYGMEEGDDLSIASALARKFGLESTEFQISSSGLQGYFTTATLDSDCRAEAIDSPMVSQLHRMLGSRFGAFFNGDECFGWHKRGIDDGMNLQLTDASHAVGLRNLHNVGRLRDWLRADVRVRAEDSIDRIINSIVEQAGAKCPADLMDVMYYEQRMGNMLNGFTAQRLRFMEQARPFLDEDVIEFVTKLPVRYRYNKYLLRKLLGVRFPGLMRVPLATKDSIPAAETYRRLFCNDAAMREYVSRSLITGMDDRLAEILDPERFIPFLRSLLEGARPPGVRTPFWTHIPGLWRFHKVTNHVNPVSLVLRVLQLNIYLTSTR
jgi:hypothetical protein